VGGAGAPARAPGFDPMMIVLLFMIVLFVFMGLSGRKQRKQREAILASVKRNDRVTTTSGIVGTVVELYDNEIVLRVDEASNTRIRFRRAAIESVQREGGTGGQGASGQVESKPKAEMAKV
jgi:preprotein translocase subunit YajC